MALAAGSSGLRNAAVHSYQVYGRTLASAIPLPELPAVGSSPEPPVAWHIDLTPALTIPPGVRWHVLWRTPAHEAWLTAGSLGSTCYFRCTRFADFEVSAGRIVVAVRGFTRPSTVRHLLLDQILPLALAAGGELVLHAAAVDVGHDAALVLCGCAGAGKSTMAAALARAGLPALADDGVLVRFEDTARAIPSYPGLRLWLDAAAAAGYAAQPLHPVAEYASKVRVPMVDASNGGDRRLGALYVLQSGGALSFRQLRGAAAVRAVLEHAFRADLREPRSLSAGLDAAVRLASAVPIWSVRVPRDLAGLDAAAREVARHAGNQCRVSSHSSGGVSEGW